MRTLKLAALLSLGLLFVPSAHAQRIGVAIGVGPAYVGPAPVCAYGYYPYYPYACAPVGYYGPSWFSGGVFIGAGPWGHGFVGHPGFYAGRGFDRGPVVAARGNYGRIPGPAAHPAFRGEVNRGGAVGHFNGGAAHGFSRAGGGAIHGGGRR